eukprot:SAG31_NODE_18289_length_641_cov_1.119926_2_plen_26_part_01
MLQTIVPPIPKAGNTLGTTVAGALVR